MPKLNQQGFSQIIILLVIVAGIILGVYLVQQQTDLGPDAAELKDYLVADKCDSDLACKSGYICQKKMCDFSKECESNPKGAMCALKRKVCGGVCIIDPNPTATASATPSARIATPSASQSGKLKVSPSPKPTDKYSPRPRTEGQICAQVITRACDPSQKDECRIFATPCDVPEGWQIAQ